MDIACIDLEGVLIPEIWPHVGKVTGIADLSVTTREEQDYPRLMQRRIELLRRHGIRLADVQRIIERLSLFDGADAFIAKLGESHQRVIILSDCFVELATYFMTLLGSPELQCHRLRAGPDDYIDGCSYLPRRGKEETVMLLQAEGHRVLAVGDAFNDLAMLRAADLSWLFRPSPETLAQADDLEAAQGYAEMLLGVERFHRHQALKTACVATG